MMNEYHLNPKVPGIYRYQIELAIEAKCDAYINIWE